MRELLSPLAVPSVGSLPSAASNPRCFAVVGSLLYWSDGSSWQQVRLTATTMAKTILGADVQSNATLNTLADVTGLSFAVTSGLRYRFRFFILYTSTAITNGSRWSINGPATTILRYRSQYTLTATSDTFNAATGYNLPAASNASSVIAGNVAIIEGVITPSANGTVIARFASELASPDNIIAKAGSYVEYEEY